MCSAPILALPMPLNTHILDETLYPKLQYNSKFRRTGIETNVHLYKKKTGLTVKVEDPECTNTTRIHDYKLYLMFALE